MQIELVAGFIGTAVVAYTVYRIIVQNHQRREQMRQKLWRWAQQQLKIVEAQLKNPLIQHFPLAQVVAHRRALVVYHRLAKTHPTKSIAGVNMHTRALADIANATAQPQPMAMLRTDAEKQAGHRLLSYLKKEKAAGELSTVECEKALEQVTMAAAYTQLQDLEKSAKDALEAKRWGSVRAALEQASAIMGEHFNPPTWMQRAKCTFDNIDAEVRAMKEKSQIAAQAPEGMNSDGLHRMWEESKSSAIVN